jgi:hypothetical protein
MPYSIESLDNKGASVSNLKLWFSHKTQVGWVYDDCLFHQQLTLKLFGNTWHKMKILLPVIMPDAIKMLLFRDNITSAYVLTIKCAMSDFITRLSKRFVDFGVMTKRNLS